MDIIFNSKVINLFKYAELLEQQRVDYILSGNADFVAINHEIWSPHRDCLYSNGPILGMLREKNNRLMELLKGTVSDNLHEDVVKLLCLYVQGAEKRGKNFIEKFTLPTCKSVRDIISYDIRKLKYPNLEGDNIIACVKKYNYLLLKDVNTTNYDKRIKYLYLYLGYDYYKENKQSLIEMEQPKIEELYHDLSDSNYHRYGLIPIDKVRVLKEGIPWRIYDTQKDKTIFLSTNTEIVRKLHELFIKGKIGKMAFRGCDKQIFSGKCDKSFLMEEVDFGKVFYLQVSALPNVTKLYSKNYNDQLWITVNKSTKEMLFEELCDGITIQDDAVVTQLVHLVYEEKDGKIIVTHMDHEYIFYDINSYSRRIDDARVKGNFKRRIKTFKIDASLIEFDYPCKMLHNSLNASKEINVPFIFFILNNCFNHRDLIKEYFENILDSNC